MPKAACCRAVQLSLSCVAEHVQALYIAMISSMAFRLVGFLYVCLAKYYRWPWRFIHSQNHVTKIEKLISQGLGIGPKSLTGDRRGKIFALNQPYIVSLSWYWEAPVNSRCCSWILGTGLVYAGTSRRPHIVYTLDFRLCAMSRKSLVHFLQQFAAALVALAFQVGDVWSHGVKRSDRNLQAELPATWAVCRCDRVRRMPSMFETPSTQIQHPITARQPSAIHSCDNTAPQRAHAKCWPSKPFALSARGWHLNFRWIVGHSQTLELSRLRSGARSCDF